ncbi:MAG: Ig-like domain-containing protein, partial [Anaerolineae bacterium]|nr:Ig-like domain-containing protein [Anaerolineae bacterium]
MLRQRHGRHARRLLSIALLVAAAFWLARFGGATGHDPLQNARRLVADAGSYRVTADIEQNFTPRPLPEMIGRKGERVVWHLEGDVGGQNYAVIELALAGQYASAPPVQVIQNGDAFFLNANGRIDRLEGENPLSTVAPTVEFLEYLEGARDVEEAGSAEIGGEQFTKYTFQFDGAQYGQYLAAKQERNSEGPLPPGATYAAPEVVRRMSGTGELWLDEAGLPRRQSLVIDMPAANAYYDGRMTLTADYRNFAEAPLPPVVVEDGAGGWHIPELFAGRPSESIFEEIDAVAATTVDAGPDASRSLALVLLLAAFLVFARFYVRRPARAYRWIILPIVGSMLLSPVLSSVPYRLFAARQAEAAERAAENVQNSPLLHALGINNAADGLSPAAPSAQRSASLELATASFSPVAGMAGQEAGATTAGCGAGESSIDADGDGLTEFVENCIGTYDLLADSDLDLITDTVEIEGFAFAGLQWVTDPLKADSNDDGLNDSVEWVQPAGSAPLWDMDGDGQPNPWDEDNDGDGVPDDIDLSPFQVSEVHQSAALSISGDPGDDYVYVEIQLQPENADHMRYALSPLDWPADARGTLQDLDDSPADLQLVPYLEAYSTAAPGDALAERYGLLVSGDDQSGYLISIPLLPLGVEAVHAFYGKVALAPGDFTTVDWEWSRLTWHVVMQNDFCGEEQCASPRVAPIHYYYEPFRITGMQVARSGEIELGVFSTPQTPTEDRALFQLMEGLSATYLAAEGVENQATGRSALAEIMSRFRNPVAPYNGTWGIETPMAVFDSPLRYAHRDALTANFGNELSSYLDTHFPDAQYEQFCAGADGVQFRCASVVLAQQARHGVTPGIDLRSEARTFLLPAGEGHDTTVQSLVAAVDLAAIDVALVREAQLQMFENLEGRWQPASDSRMMEIVEDRYAGRWNQLAQQTQAIYPSVAPILVHFGAYAGYLIYRAGFQSVIALNGTPLVVAVSADSALTQDRAIVGSDLPDAASVALENAGLTEQVEVGGATVDVALLLGDTLLSAWGDIGLLITKILLLVEEPADTVAGQRWNTGNAVAAGIALILSLTFATIAFGFSVAQLACAAKEARGDGQCDEQALQAVEKTGTAINGASAAASVVFAALAIVFAVQSAAGAGVSATAAAVGIVFSVVAIVIAVIMLVATLVLIWVMFALLVTSTSSQMAIDTAVGQAVAGSLVAVLVFLITFIVGVVTIVVLALAIAGVLTAATAGWFLVAIAVIGLVLAVIILIDVIFGLIMLGVTGKYQNVSTAFFNFLADFFSQTTLLTSLEDSAFRGTGTTYAPTNSFMRATGAAVGNEFLVDDYFGAYLTTDGNDGYDFFDNNLPRVVNGDGGDLRRSGAAAWYEGESVRRLAGDAVTVESVAIASADNSFPGAGFDVSQNARCTEPFGDRRHCDSDLGMRYTFVQAMRNAPLIVDTKVAVELRYELCVFNLIGACVYKDQKSENVRLPKGDQKEDYRLNLYVDILPETLSEFWNWDEIDNPDPDADGLSSSEESALGLDPAAWDSDGDGISDRFEVEQQTLLGLDPQHADWDQDGVSDREEVRNGTDPRVPDSDGDGLTDAEEIGPESGWMVTVPTSGDVRVFSDPRRPDADGDYLPDVQERDFGLSPFAANDAPALAVGVEPLHSNPNGRRAVVTRPGDTVTTTVVLASVGSAAVDQPLTLCLPPFLANARVAHEGGDRVPPRQAASTCAGFEWRFDQAVLQRGELFEATLLAEVDGGINSSQQAELTYNLLYRDTPLAGATTVVVDVDDPTVAFRLPAEGQFLRGTSYVAGGAAGDATSWVDRVEVDLGAGYVQATGQSPWAQTWTLPADGAYTLRARSFDAVGRQSAVAARSVIVDNTPPTLDTIFGDGALITGSGITVTLSGNAGDNLSGVSRVQLRIDGAPWQEVSLSGNGTAETWRFAWTVGAAAQGSHEFLLRTFDRAGNVSALLQRTAVVDVLAPSSDLTGRISSAEVPVFSPDDTLRGYANERGHLPLAPRPVELEGDVDALQNATVWLSPDSILDDDAGVSLLWLGDVNGDGLGDLAVGLPAANDGDGRVNLFFGRTGDFALPDEAELLSDGDSSFAGSDGAGLGGTLAAPGDVNGDGLADILIGDPANNRVILVLGRVFQYGKESVLGDTIRGTRYTFTAPDGFGLGSWVNAAGDVNGDGRRDLLLGGSEQAVLILGDDIAWFGNIDVTMAAALTFNVESADRLEGVGDLNGDQLDEWVWRNGSGLVVQSAASIGDALAPEALTPVDPARSHAVLAAAATGEIEPLGDVDGDGLDDFLFDDGGLPRLVYGREDAAYTVGISFGSLAPAGWLAAPGDVNADGLNDIVIGADGNRAHLIHGAAALPATPPVQATIAGVSGAASTPFASGADLNCDFSSDLLLLPEEAGIEQLEAEQIDFTNGGTYQLNRLPLAQPAEESNRRQLTAVAAVVVHFVDDDGFCDGNTPCHVSLQDAINEAGAGDTIQIHPGVYQPATIRNNGVTVRGVNADAVFVDAAGSGTAVTVDNATGARLEGMTIRNAEIGVQLINAGDGGEHDAHLKTQVQNVLVHAVRHAVSMDRTSTLQVDDSTFAVNGAGEAVLVTGEADPEYLPTFSRMSAIPGGGIGSSGDLFINSVRTTLVAPSAASDPAVYNYNIAGDSWTTTAGAPANIGDSPQLYLYNGNTFGVLRGADFGSGATRFGLASRARIRAISRQSRSVGPDHIYVGGRFDQIDGTPARNVAFWDGAQWRPLGGGVEGNEVHAIAVVGTFVYVGGRFNRVVQPDGARLAVSNLARWNTSSLRWDNANGALALSGTVYALEGDGGSGVYAGGAFDEPSGPPRGGIDGLPFGVPERCLPNDFQVALFQKQDFGADQPGEWCQILGVGDYGNTNPNAYDFPPNEPRSMIVGSKVRTILYDKVGFDGNDVTLSSTMENLNRIRFDYGAGRVGGDLGSMRVVVDNYARTQPVATCQPNDYQVALYNDENYTGECWLLDAGEHHNSDGNAPWHAKANSMVVGDLVYVEAYKNVDFGEPKRLVADTRFRLDNLRFDGGSNSLRNDIRSLKVVVKASRHRVARWTGSGWQSLDGGVGGNPQAVVFALERRFGTLYVGGSFEQAATRPQGNTNFAAWNGATGEWNPASATEVAAVDGPVRAIAAAEGALLIGGSFSSIVLQSSGGILPAGNVALRTGSGWNVNPLFGLDDTVYSLAIDGSGRFFAGGDFTGRLRRWNGTVWGQHEGGTDGTVFALHDDDRDLYAGGRFSQAGNVANANLGRWTQSYLLPSGQPWQQWDSLSYHPLLQRFGDAVEGASGNGRMYLLFVENAQFKFYQREIQSDIWRELTPPSTSVAPRLDDNSQLAWGGDSLYLMLGSDDSARQRFLRYDIAGNRWHTLAQPPFKAINPGLAWDDGDHVYVAAAGSSNTLLARYQIGGGQWQMLDSLAPTLPRIQAGSNLVRAQDAFYLTLGGGSSGLWRIEVPDAAPLKLALQDTVIAVPPTTSNATWLGLEQTEPVMLDFGYTGGNVELVGGRGTDWTPPPGNTPGATRYTYGQAQFADSARDVYRTGAGSALDGGYYDYVPPATVSVAACSGCYSSIQAAVDSGAQTVLVEPGVYRQPFYMVSGLSVYGSGAELTIIEPPGGSNGARPLVSAEGIRSGMLARVTLNGAQTSDGLVVEDGARHLRIARNIVRDAVDAIVLRGSATATEIFNNTLVDNEGGIVAVAGAPVDVRNTLFVNHDNAGLSYMSGAPTRLHRYNGYFGNGVDLRIDGEAAGDPGIGEIFADPFFVNPQNDDFRLGENSPMIDAGDPADPAPPGANGRADIGFAEHGAAGF